ncbi:hypothetical protein SAMN02745126_01076 [Enhydrobacter aerosaccus]|uniref:DUF4175 domain-containing protein n=1 Tax=Enhydrobacter aerosaccus TaxID=225324 RepID=A0A1T4KP86_9HYPH|nr:hypothetical protein SAMN02745126_01076 [Enhydrobacter aerosaccus]
MTTRNSAVWRWPIMLALLTVFGLLSALLGEGGVWWPLSWLALASPLVAIGACLAAGIDRTARH